MNKPFRFFTVSMFALLVALPAYAATLALSPTTISVVKGQNVSIVISVDPAGSKLYTVKSSISFPASLLEMTSFTQSAGWVPLSMPGYDSVDNTNGTVVKTAGYPGGFSNATTFGTLVFRAKESGTATISVANTSFAYDAQSKNTISGTQGSSVITVTAPVVAPVVTPKIVTPKKPVQTTVTSAPANTVQTTEVAPAQVIEQVSSTSSQPQAAAVAAAGTGSSIPMWAWLALLAVVIVGVGWWVYRRFSREY